MLRTMEHDDYHTFRTHFWDWRHEIQMTSPSIFQESRLSVPCWKPIFEVWMSIITVVGFWYWKTGLNSVQKQHLCGMCHAWSDKVEKTKAINYFVIVCVYL